MKKRMLVREGQISQLTMYRGTKVLYNHRPNATCYANIIICLENPPLILAVISCIYIRYPFNRVKKQWQVLISKPGAMETVGISHGQGRVWPVTNRALYSHFVQAISAIFSQGILSIDGPRTHNNSIMQGMQGHSRGSVNSYYGLCQKTKKHHYLCGPAPHIYIYTVVCMYCMYINLI